MPSLLALMNSSYPSSYHAIADIDANKFTISVTFAWSKFSSKHEPAISGHSRAYYVFSIGVIVQSDDNCNADQLSTPHVDTKLYVSSRFTTL
jgi:hypothetical protein